jgi:deoxyribodipyrimidine photolyase
VTWTYDKEAEHQRLRADFAEEQVERLKQQLAEADARALVREAEIERLQAIIEANDNYDQDATEREVERLRAAATAVFMNPLDIDAMLKLGEVLGEVTPIHTDP